MNTSCQCFHRVLYIMLYKVDLSYNPSVKPLKQSPLTSALVCIIFLKNFATGNVNSFVKFNFGHCFKGFEVVNLFHKFFARFPKKSAVKARYQLTRSSV